MKNHPIAAKFHLNTNQLELQYDSVTRDLFQKVVDPLRTFIKSDLVQLSAATSIENFETGLAILTQLAAETSPRITGLGADLALEYVSWASRFLAVDRSSAELFSHVVLLLAELSFVPIVPFSLPPLEELIDEHTVPAAVRRSYDTIRLSKGANPTVLSTRQMYDLGFALNKISTQIDAVDALLSELDAQTAFFRATINFLAQKYLSSSTKQEAF